MEIVSRAAAVGIIGCILALMLKKYTPELSLVLMTATGAVVLWLSFHVCSDILQTVRTMAEENGVAAEYISPVIKCVAIALITELASQISRDAQQGSVSSAIQLCGTFCAVYVTLPLTEALLSVVKKLL